jgi:hypothetical protein
MRILLTAAAAATLVSLVSCESTVTAGAPRMAATYAASESYTPFAGGAPRSASYTPPERYYAFGGGYSSARRQMEGDDYNFLRYNDHCYRRCGHYSYCGSGYGWRGSSCYYRPRCW